MKLFSKRKVNRILIIIFVIMAVTGIESNAQDWSQWRGQNRDGVVKRSGLNLDWTTNKPALLWTFRQAGVGYSAPVVAGNTLYCQGSADGKDFAFALDTKTGNLKWKKEFGEQFNHDRGNGPRGSITVDGDKLYLVRAGGQFLCLSAADGIILWQKDFKTEFASDLQSNFGFGESPLIDGNLVICTPGGKEGTMAALDKNTGDLVWRSKEWTDPASYSSVIVADIDGIRQYIQVASKGTAGIAAKDGKLLWKAEIGGNKTASATTPIYNDHTVYITSGYNAGCGLVRLTREGDRFKTDTVYTNRNMTNHHGGVVLMNGYIYGFSDADWVCQDLKTGEIVWKERNNEIGKGSLLGVNERLILFGERSGIIALVAASPDGWKEFGRITIPERTKEVLSGDNMLRTHPIIANGKLYIREHDLLFCFDLQK